jgi:hypothetical protein
VKLDVREGEMRGKTYGEVGGRNEERYQERKLKLRRGTGNGMSRRR